MYDENNYPYHIDLHVHTRRYSRCAELLDPAALGQQMQARGLHGIVLTEHDAIWPSEDIRSLNDRFNGVKIYAGVEVSSCDGHFIVIGCDNLEGLEPGVSSADIIKKAADHDAAVILVHHHVNYHQGGKKPVDIRSLPAGIDAIEVASSMTYGTKQAEALQIAASRKWHPVAGSDAHHISVVGEAFTAFRKLASDEKSLARAIKNGLGRPVRFAEIDR